MIIMSRFAIFVILLAALSICSGCKTTSRSEKVPTSYRTPSSTAPDEQTTKLINTFGEHRIGNTVIEANQSDGKLTVKHLSQKVYPAGGKSTSSSSTSPNEWPLHDGWFAYAHQNGAYVWLYNGSDKLLLVERKETPAQNSTNIYGPHNSPIPIPTAVLKHIKEPFRSTLSQR